MQGVLVEHQARTQEAAAVLAGTQAMVAQEPLVLHRPMGHRVLVAGAVAAALAVLAVVSVFWGLEAMVLAVFLGAPTLEAAAAEHHRPLVLLAHTAAAACF